MAALFGEEQKAQAALMLTDRLRGLSAKEIAAKYNCSIDTVERRMKVARREQMLENAAERVIENLLDRAMDAYEELVEQTDDKKVRLEAARDIAFGTGVLSKQNKALVNPHQQGELTLRAWRERRLAKGSIPKRVKGRQPSSASGVDEEIGVIEVTAVLPAGAEAGSFEVDGEDCLPDLDEFTDFPLDGEEG